MRPIAGFAGKRGKQSSHVLRAHEAGFPHDTAMITEVRPTPLSLEEANPYRFVPLDPGCALTLRSSPSRKGFRRRCDASSEKLLTRAPRLTASG